METKPRQLSSVEVFSSEQKSAGKVLCCSYIFFINIPIFITVDICLLIMTV